MKKQLSSKWISMLLAAATMTSPLGVYAQEQSFSEEPAQETVISDNFSEVGEAQVDSKTEFAAENDESLEDAPVQEPALVEPFTGAWASGNKEKDTASYLFCGPFKAADVVNELKNSKVFQNTLTNTKESGQKILLVIRSGGSENKNQGLQPGYELAASLDAEAKKRIVPVVWIDAAVSQHGSKFAYDLLEMYESLTGVKGYILASQNVMDVLDWDTCPERYERFVHVDSGDGMENVTKALTEEKLARRFETSENFGKLSSTYRFYNPNTGEHVYTNDPREAGVLLNVGWQYESFAWATPSTGTDVYRLYNPNDGGDHHYTTDANEVKNLVKAGWKDEGVFFKSADAKSGVPIYRLYNPNQKVNNHHFTDDKNEHDALVKYGWKDEGIAFYMNECVVPSRYVPGANYLKGNVGYNLNSARLSGINPLDGKYYLFNADGTRNTKAGMQTLASGASVYVQADGSLARNQLITSNGHTFYFNENCHRINNSYYRLGDCDYHFNADGVWDNANDVEIQKLCNEVYAKVGKDLRALYNYVNAFTYETLPIPLNPPAGWTREQNYAKRGLTQHKGNCYCFAASMTALARYAGYDVTFIEGYVRYVSGKMAEHGWTEINLNGARYIMDPELQKSYPTLNFYLQPVGAPTVAYAYTR